MQQPNKQDTYTTQPAGTNQQAVSSRDGTMCPPVTTVPHVRIKDYLGTSIFNLLCCCFPFGLAALLYSIQTRDALARRDLASASRYSQTAFRLNIGSFIFGILCIVCIITYLICFGFPNNSNYGFPKDPV
ncbi:synapse differentiation-inducing gene protein 1 [Xenopus laevis]|uniref:Synapse differentiation-inducing gene protein 1 n=2 Tax=Xenopus laevis TaxID=8355 RepID=A0A1L8FPH1_XENLA|nr:synapse differentiation-inducing gene protein 1 [Xenopus laevis]OCT73468.1 hypothetical protein XELAEV_18036445mg [Xenopus laevis]